jgi:hypothetical protein
MLGANHQRLGATSNTAVGLQFELDAQRYWKSQGLELERNFPIELGFETKRVHKFDLGTNSTPTIIECKANRWTVGANSPSAKIRGMNEALLYFYLAPVKYRKILFVLRHMRKEKSLAKHYIDNNGHLIPHGVEVWEFDPEDLAVERVR